jgi:hypothetical protein
MFLCDLIGQDSEIIGNGGKKETSERVLSLLDWGLTLEGITKEQRDMVEKIIDVIKEAAPKGKSVRAGRKKSSVK